MDTGSIIGAIVTLVLVTPVALWLTNLVRSPRLEEEAIHRKVAQARRDVRGRIDKLPHARV